MSAVSLVLDNYIMLAVLPGLWVLLGSNVHLKRKTIRITRVVMILIFLEAKQKVLKAFNDAIADYSGQKHYDVKYRLNTKNGGWRKFHAMGRLLRREDGTPLSYVGMFVEIKEQ